MRLHAGVFTVFLALVGFDLAPLCAGQVFQEIPVKGVMDDYGGAPIRGAVKALREKYNLPITYEGPLYACPCDLVDMTNLRKTPGPRIIVPRSRSFHFEYAEVNGKPQEETAQLLKRLVDEFAAQGGQVFEVRERVLPTGIQWNVVAKRARGSLGDFVDQPDILGAPIFIPKARRNEDEFLTEIVQQLSTVTGYQVRFGGSDSNTLMGVAELGADNISARDALTSPYGTRMVWELNYDPEHGGRYFLNLSWITPPALPSLDPYSMPRAKATGIPDDFDKRRAALRRLGTPSGRMELQSRLAQGGYYTGEPSGEWDRKTADALSKFQAANNLRVTGKPNQPTLQKLGWFPGLTSE
jgi:putative peptidoglycan binding protein